MGEDLITEEQRQGMTHSVEEQPEMPDVETEATQTTQEATEVVATPWNAETRRAWRDRHLGKYGMSLNELTYDQIKNRK